MSQDSALTIASQTNQQPTLKGAKLMLSKRIFWTLLIAVMIALSATVTQAQSTEQTGENKEQQETQTAGQGGGILDVLERQKTAIVGTWLTTLASGSKGLITFHADGTVILSTQGAVSTAPNRPPHTSLHGVWRHLGGRQFGYTVWDIWYDVNTAQLIQFARIRAEVTLSEDRDEASVRGKLDFFNPQGDVLLSREGLSNFKRIKFEPID
jgi:hypothetical protein